MYIDNIVIKSKRLFEHAKDAAEDFDILDKVEIKLNIEKCTFSVESSKLVI